MSRTNADGTTSCDELDTIPAAAVRARELGRNEAMARIQRTLADQSSIAFQDIGAGYDLSVYDGQCAEPFSWRDNIEEDDINDDELASYMNGALQRLPLVADQLNHAVTAMILAPTREVGVGHLMEALDRVVDTVGTLKVVSDELDRRGSRAAWPGE